MVRRIGRIAEPEKDVGGLDQCLRPGNADCLDRILARAQAGGVGQKNGYAVDRQRHFNMIARCTRNGRDNCSLITSYRIEKARFASVWWTRNDDPDTVLQWLDAGPAEPFAQFTGQVGAARGQRWIHRLIILIIVDRSFGACRQRKQALLPQPNLLAQPAFGQGQGGLALRFGLRLDQVGEALGFGQVDTTVSECPPSELAGLGLA